MSTTRSSTVLVMGLDAPEREEVRRFLDGRGLEFRESPDIDELIRSIGSDSPRLAVVDLDALPVQAVPYVLRFVKSADREVGVLCVTERPSVPGAMEAMRNGASHYAGKPIEAEALEAAIRDETTSTSPELVPGLVGRELRRRRLDVGLTLQCVASRSGLSASQVSLAERGEGAMTIRTLHRIASALHTPMADFFEGFGGGRYAVSVRSDQGAAYGTWRDAGPGRRQGPRVAAEVRLRLEIGGLPGLLAGESREVGTGGACVATQTPFALKSLQRVEVELPGVRMRLRAEGRWQREVPGENAVLSGVEFDVTDQEEARRLWAFVRCRAEELARFLEEGSNLAGLGIDELVQIALASRCRRVSAGELVYDQGGGARDCDSVFFVLEGCVAFEKTLNSGSRREACRAATGDVFGGLPLVAGLRHVESAVAVGEALLLEINAYSMGHFEVHNPPLARAIARAAVKSQMAHLGRLLESP